MGSRKFFSMTFLPLTFLPVYHVLLLRNLIFCYYAFIMAFNFNELEKNIEKLPPLSPSVSKILKITNDPSSSAGNLNKVISFDPVLTARVLKLVNSAYFALSKKATSIVRSIVILGFNTIKNLALSAAILDTFLKVKSDIFPVDEFWEHSLAVASISKLLAKELKVGSTLLEEYFICGLLHDIGKLVFLSFYQEEFLKAVELSSDKNIDLSEAEMQIIGCNHLEAGEILAKKWKFTGNIKETIGMHDTLDLSGDNKYSIRNIVFIADIVSRSEGIGNSGNYYLPDDIDSYFEKLGISMEIILKLSDNLNSELNKAKSFLQMDKK